MANVKKGNLTAPPQWWKHLKWCKRTFWKAERQAHKDAIKKETNETVSTPTKDTSPTRQS
jgi:hypothetical protein